MAGKKEGWFSDRQISRALRLTFGDVRAAAEFLLGDIQKLKDFGQSLLGTQYAKWVPSMGFTPGPPFWINSTEPSIDTVREQGVNCLGVANLVRLHFGQSAEKNLFDVLLQQGSLKKFDPKENYPFGTLLLRPFHDNDHDQGHYAIMWENGNILHAYAKVDEGGFFTDISADQLAPPGVVIEPLEISNSWFTPNTYTHISEPVEWLTPVS